MSTPTFPSLPPDPETAFVAALEAFQADDVQPEGVRALSDLTRSQRSRLSRRWSGWSEETRRSIVRTMETLQRSNVELLFGRAYRVALADSDPWVRQLAVAGLWEDTAEDVLTNLVELLTHDPSQDVRAEAARALGRFVELAIEEEDEEVEEMLRDILLDAVNDEDLHEIVRNNAIESLGFCSDAEVSAVLREAYASDETATVCAAVTAMGRSRRAEWLDDVTAMFDDEDDDLREAAAVACGSIADSAAVGELAQAALDPSQAVRIAALNALASIGGRAATRVLEAAAENEEYPDRIAAESALERLSDDAMVS